jgi:predicted DNA-binding transcriptional regulator AlpA
MSTQQHSTELERWALDADDVARLLNVSKRHVAALNSSGRLPRPIKLGRRTVWVADELREWLAAGAPERSRWETMRQASEQ